ncbi:hypothetical protein AAE478_001466 [Parahypoxylon ruwenzoriense]
MSSAAVAVVDVLILGGGPAGLACANGLARQLHTAIVFTHNTYRNARAAHMHNVAGWEHTDPTSFRSKARADIIARYSDTIQFRDVEVQSVRRIEDNQEGHTRFEVEDVEGRRYEGRKVVLAMGVQDVMPETPQGYAELWGYGIFHCLFCHGFEEQGAPSAGVLAMGPFLGGANETLFAPAIARMAGRLASSVTVYTDGDESLGARIRAELRSTKKFHIENRRVAKLAKDPDVQGEAGVLVTLEDGAVNRERFLTHVPSVTLNIPTAVSSLGVAIAPQGHIETSAPFYATSAAGVYAAGDCATMMQSVAEATMMGSFVAAGLAQDLQAEDDVDN